MKIKDLQKIEFWAITVSYIIALIVLIDKANNRTGIDTDLFQNAHVGYSHFSTYLVPLFFQYTIIYGSILLLIFFIFPNFYNKKRTVLNSFLLFSTLIAGTLVIGITKTYSVAYKLVEYHSLQQAYNHIFFNSFSFTVWLIVLAGSYFLIKTATLYFIENKEKSTEAEYQIKTDAAIGLIFWFVGLLFWLVSDVNYKVTFVWTLVVFSNIGITIYAIHFLLPGLYAESKRFRKYFWRIALITIVISMPVCLIGMLFCNTGDEIVVLWVLHLASQFFVSLPLAWFIHKRRYANSLEIKNLRTDLRKSDANLNFLKSQINPHFLFNALNTLFGTALQENAERTGEGIQKLGDMMRFMLHENTQDKISLTREVEYLNNYIDLQKLRTSRSADIRIEAQIEEQINNLQITPMLLIPFIENAFKHGISLQQPSYIKMTLQTKESTLYFDVSNSIYIKADNDPEKLKSGIGLENVKQRLSLLYPGKHELIIRESANEFFVHLTLKLV